ncbi:MAG: tyrosine-type recombinase/integrase [Rhabdochlamydiaceae bacterium]
MPQTGGGLVTEHYLLPDPFPPRQTDVEKLNTDKAITVSNEDRKWSDMGNKTLTEKKETPETIKDRLREKIRRRSHSLKSEITFDSATISFERFLRSRDLTYHDCLESPIQAIDDYVAWLDRNNRSPSSIATYVNFVKKTLKFMGAKIDAEEFKERVTMPKIRPFQDEKVDRDQIRRIVLCLKHLQLKAVLMLMKDTMARPAELVGLRVSDLNLSYDPPYLNIPAERAKNDLPRELFFTHETKELLLAHIKRKNKKGSDFLFLNDADSLDEMELQRKIENTTQVFSQVFRRMLSKPEFEDLRGTVNQRGAVTRYKIHPYSFKKFAFTTMADTLGEVATRAIKGDRKYVFTYYRKSRDERAADYRKVMPKLLIFAQDEILKSKEELESKIRTMDAEDLARLQEFLGDCKNQARE